MINEFFVEKQDRQHHMIRIRIYTGTLEDSPFHVALSNTGVYQDSRFSVEKISNSQIRKMIEWTHPKFLVDWLLNSDMHIISCPGLYHGTLVSGIEWDVRDVSTEIDRLKTHKGFPENDELDDAIFRGDKYSYLDAVHSKCLPIFKILLTRDAPGYPTMFIRSMNCLGVYPGIFSVRCL